MTSKQRIKLRMYLAVRNFVGINDAVAKVIPKFMASYGTLQTATNEIQLIGEKQGIDNTGVAIDKNKLKIKLIELALKNSRKISALAKFNNNDTLLKEVRFNESDLLRGQEVKLRDNCKTIYDCGEANIAALAEHGVTPDTQKEFLDTLTAFNNSLEMPRTGKGEKKKLTERLTILFDTADKAIELMDYAVGIVKDEQVDFCNAYKMNRKLVDTNTGKVALKAKATDGLTGAPIKGVIFTFHPEGVSSTLTAGNGKLVKKTANKGSFQIKNMDAGTYKVSVSKPGYKDKEVSVSISDGERSDLMVLLEK
jgi:Carboxypeptidase regulatory-like domain